MTSKLIACMKEVFVWLCAYECRSETADIPSELELQVGCKLPEVGAELNLGLLQRAAGTLNC